MKIIHSLIVSQLMLILTLGAQDCGKAFTEDFQSYSVSSTNKFICQIPTNLCWTTWSANRNCVNNYEDAPIVNLSNNKCLAIISDNCINKGPSDIVRRLGNATSGIEEFSFDIYIKSGKTGFVTFLHDYSSNGINTDESWAFDLSFNDCIMYITLHGNQNQKYTFNYYRHDYWHNIKVILDYNNNKCTIVFDYQRSFPFTISSYYSKNTSNNKYIRAVDFYADECSHYYVDNVIYKPSTIQNQSCSISPINIQNDFSANDNILSISSNTSWTLERPVNATWIHFGTASNSSPSYPGNNSQDLHVIVDFNNLSTPRNALLTFTCSNGLKEIIQINQEETAYCSLSPNPIYSDSYPKTLSVDALTNSSWSLSIPTNIDWLEFTNGSKILSLVGGATIPIKIKENLSVNSRTAILSFLCNGVPSNLSIFQSGKPVSATCNISPSILNFSDLGGTNQISISSNTNWTLDVQPTLPSWVVIKEGVIPISSFPHPGVGTIQYYIEVHANLSKNAREINLLFTCSGNTQTVKISQAGQTTSPNQSPCWPMPEVTDRRHLIIIPYNVQVDLDGLGLDIGDWIGFFYLDGATEYCAGQGEWKGTDLAITVFGDDNFTSGKNGFDDKEKFILKICRINSNKLIDVTGTFYSSGIGRYTDENCFKYNGTSGILRLEYTTNCLKLPIRNGYNIVSSYVLPKDPNMLKIFSLRTNDVYVFDQSGNQTLPFLNINNIGDWDILQGYEVRSKDTFKIDKVFCGSKVDPSKFQFNIAPNKWKIISYLKDTPKSIDDIFSVNNVKSRISIIKNDDGKVYIPLLGINTIGSMMPYKGYYINTNSVLTFNYPNFTNENAKIRTNYKNDPWEATTFAFKPMRTGNNCVLVFPNEIISKFLNINDEVGVFDENNNILGSVKYYGESMALTVWGKDKLCEDNCLGFSEDEQMTFKIWNSNQNTMKYISIKFEDNANAKYRYNGLFYAEILSETNFTGTSINYTLINNGILIQGSNSYSFSIYNTLGQILESKRNSQGNKIDLNSLNSGVYFIEVIISDKRQIIKFLKH